LRGRDFVIPDDVKAVAVACLAHRMMINPEYALGGQTTADVVRDLLKQVKVPVES
jgi:MoxR-like ATPase